MMPARWCSSTAPRACRTCQSMCRHSISIFWPSPGTKWSVRWARACSMASGQLLDAMPPLHGRRQHDPQGARSTGPLSPTSRPVRSRHPRGRRRRSVSAAAVEYLKALGMDGVREHMSWSCSTTRMERLDEVPDSTQFGPATSRSRSGVDLVHAGRHPCARCRRDSRQRECRGAGRAPLQSAV